MGMGIGINAQKPDAGRIKGRQEPVACGVWFTSTGRAIPKIIKMQNGQDGYKILDTVRVISCADKYYCGIPTVEYECETENEGVSRRFSLLYYPEKREWKLLWK